MDIYKDIKDNQIINKSIVLSVLGDTDLQKSVDNAKESKIRKVMKEFKEGTLKSSSGEKVTDRKQAIAIAISEAENVEKSITNFSEEERKKLSEKGEAMPDGSFPIRNKQDVKDAARQWGRAKNPEVAKAWIKKRAKDLGCEDCLPDKWDIEKSEDNDSEDNVQKSVFDEIQENIEKSLNSISAKVNEDLLNEIEKSISHKYFKREGTPGNYKYYYTESEYKNRVSHKAEKGNIGENYNETSLESLVKRKDPDERHFEDMNDEELKYLHDFANTNLFNSKLDSFTKDRVKSWYKISLSELGSRKKKNVKEEDYKGNKPGNIEHYEKWVDDKGLDTYFSNENWNKYSKQYELGSKKPSWWKDNSKGPNKKSSKQLHDIADKLKLKLDKIKSDYENGRRGTTKFDVGEAEDIYEHARGLAYQVEEDEEDEKDKKVQEIKFDLEDLLNLDSTYLYEHFYQNNSEEMEELGEKQQKIYKKYLGEDLSKYFSREDSIEESMKKVYSELKSSPKKFNDFMTEMGNVTSSIVDNIE